MSDAVTTPPSALRIVARPTAPSPFSNALGFGWRAMLKFKHVLTLLLAPVTLLRCRRQ